jgi:hypothetical protein
MAEHLGVEPRIDFATDGLRYELGGALETIIQTERDTASAAPCSSRKDDPGRI